MTWYEQWFSRDEYDVLYNNRNDDDAVALIDLIESLVGARPDSRVLDVGCGRGRHALELARRGYRVTGLDLSERALETARSRAAEEELEIEFIAGDMRNPIGRGQFDCVVNLFTAFGYFEAWSDHQKAVDAMALAVKPGGIVIQDFLNPAHVAMKLIPSDSRKIGDTLIEQRRWIDEGRVLKEIVFSGAQGSHTFFESVALLELSDFESLYQHAGLTIDAIKGDYSSSPFSEESPRMILFSKRVE